MSVGLHGASARRGEESIRGVVKGAGHVHFHKNLCVVGDRADCHRPLVFASVNHHVEFDGWTTRQTEVVYQAIFFHDCVEKPQRVGRVRLDASVSGITVTTQHIMGLTSILLRVSTSVIHWIYGGVTFQESGALSLEDLQLKHVVDGKLTILCTTHNANIN